MMEQLFNNISSKEKDNAVEKLFQNSVPSPGFFLMIVLSVLMATFGLLTNSPAVIVGSMLIAPLLYPMLGLAMGIVMSDFQLIKKSFMTVVKTSLLGIGIAVIVTLLFSSQSAGLNSEILSRTNPSLLSAVIGAVAGFAAAFAMVKEKLNEMLPGVAISVALIPPLAVVGIGVASFNLDVLVNSLLLYLVNVFAVIFTATIVFSLMNFHGKRKVAEAVVEKEEKKLVKEVEKTKKDF